MSYILKLTTESHLLTGSGEGGVLIDADVGVSLYWISYDPSPTDQGHAEGKP
ncbi:MAG: hypothetical protein IPK21_13810 [Haliscomenobacter sp.]|nr:hypothetical protein [Haliscomenobacter sp.]